MSRSDELFTAAQRHIPRRVTSPLSASRAVGGTPLALARAAGAWVIAADGTSYIDHVPSRAPLLVGHGLPAVLDAIRARPGKGLPFGAPTERETRRADRPCEAVPGLDMVRMVNSGTEATMSAIRLARGFTGRDTIIKFEGCYHGHSD